MRSSLLLKFMAGYVQKMCCKDVSYKNVVVWDVALCSSCVNRHFRGTYRLHFQGRKIRDRGTSVSGWLQILFPPKRRFIQDLHNATSQKTAFLIVTFEKTASFTHKLQFCCGISSTSDVMVTPL
jgi:hypothetical protein